MRKKWFKARLSDEEFEKLKAICSGNMSQYLREKIEEDSMFLIKKSTDLDRMPHSWTKITEEDLKKHQSTHGSVQ